MSIYFKLIAMIILLTWAGFGYMDNWLPDAILYAGIVLMFAGILTESYGDSDEQR